MVRRMIFKLVHVVPAVMHILMMVLRRSFQLCFHMNLRFTFLSLFGVKSAPAEVVGLNSNLGSLVTEEVPAEGSELLDE